MNRHDTNYQCLNSDSLLHTMQWINMIQNRHFSSSFSHRHMIDSVQALRGKGLNILVARKLISTVKHTTVLHLVVPLTARYKKKMTTISWTAVLKHTTIDNNRTVGPQYLHCCKTIVFQPCKYWLLFPPQTILPCSELPLARELALSTWTILPVLARS